MKTILLCTLALAALSFGRCAAGDFDQLLATLSSTDFSGSFDQDFSELINSLETFPMDSNNTIGTVSRTRTVIVAEPTVSMSMNNTAAVESSELQKILYQRLKYLIEKRSSIMKETADIKAKIGMISDFVSKYGQKRKIVESLLCRLESKKKALDVQVAALRSQYLEMAAVQRRTTEYYEKLNSFQARAGGKNGQYLVLIQRLSQILVSLKKSLSEIDVEVGRIRGYSSVPTTGFYGDYTGALGQTVSGECSCKNQTAEIISELKGIADADLARYIGAEVLGHDGQK